MALSNGNDASLRAVSLSCDGAGVRVQVRSLHEDVHAELRLRQPHGVHAAGLRGGAGGVGPSHGPARQRVRASPNTYWGFPSI